MNTANKTWSDLGFFIEITKDQSPSLRLFKSLDPEREHGEAMHHSGGAWTETDLIYGTCIRKAFEEIKEPCFLVVGLGLGYIEMTIAKEALLNQKKISHLHSFESHPDLRQFFVDWLHDKALLEEIRNTYDHALSFVLKDTTPQKLSPTKVKELLKMHFPDVSAISAGLSESSLVEPRANVILYDAFSSKTSPELWEESFLKDFFHRGTQVQAMLATYANKGNLKRALAAEGFVVQRNRGFSGKRNSTFAYRN